MSFVTNGNGKGNGKGVPLRAEDYAPLWPMVPCSAKVSVTINGEQVEAEEGQTILQACRVLGIDVPTLCYEPKLAAFGACRTERVAPLLAPLADGLAGAPLGSARP